MLKTILTIFIFYFILMLTACDSKTPVPSPDTFVANDLSAWQADAGDWFVCGSASMDPANEEHLITSAGTGILVNGKEGDTIDLHSRAQFGDIEVHIEFMVPRGSNSGIYFMSRYEIQVLDSWGKDTVTFGDAGGIYERWDENRSPEGYEGVPPRVNAAKKPGEWQEYDIIFRAPRFDSNGQKTANAQFVKVVFNDTLIHENVEVSGPTREATFRDEQAIGPLMLQGDHGPVAYRNIRISRL